MTFITWKSANIVSYYHNKMFSIVHYRAYPSAITNVVYILATD